MNVKLKFEEIWICSVTIFICISFACGATTSKTAIIIKEDPLVDKITRVNHNLKLVKLKKVKKVYTNLQDGPETDQFGDGQFSKKPTIVDLDAKYNVITQTPIPFLILEKPTEPSSLRDEHFDLIRRKDLITEREIREKIFKTNQNARDHLTSGQFGEKPPLLNLNQAKPSFPNLNQAKPPFPNLNHDKPPGPTSRQNFNLFKHEEKKLGKTILLNGKLVKEIDRRNDLKDEKAEKANEISPRDQGNDSRSKSIRVLFPSSGSKFKLSQFNKSYPANRSASIHPIASASDKSSARAEFLNKITTRSRPKITTTTTTARPLTTNKRSFVKPDKFKSFTTTTTEPPKTFTYKPSRRTTTFKPYIYTTISVTTSEPILRIVRKNRPTITQTKSTTTLSTTPSPVDRKPKIELKNELKHELLSTINSLDFGGERPDLESNNSNRKYAKLFFDSDKLDKKKKSRIENDKAEGTRLSKESKDDKPQTTTSRPTIRSYWRANSRPPYTSHFSTQFTTQRPTSNVRPITASYSPYSTVTSPVTERRRTYETTTETMKVSRIHEIMKGNRRYETTTESVKESRIHETTTGIPKRRSYETTTEIPKRRSYETTTEMPKRRSYETTTEGFTETLKRRRHETTTESLKRRSYETTTESILKNEINREKILTAVRKRPIYRPRTVTPTQLTLLTTVRSSTEQPITTTESSFRLTTVYSPRFRSTTIYPLSYRSTTESTIGLTTESSVSDRFTTRFRYAATPAFTTASYKETSFYQPKSAEPDTPTDSPLSTSNDLMSNFIPRRSKWVLKSTRQRKSDHKEEPSTRPMYSSRSTQSTPKPILTTRPSYSATTTPSPVEPITRRTFVTTTSNEISKLPIAYKTIDRTPKSTNKKPKSFFAEEPKPKENEPDDSNYEPPKRERNTPVDLSLIDADREIHYQDVKVRKESKLVPQTYIYSTSAPATVARLNERLSHLNEEKAKYQRLPYMSNNAVDDGRIETYRRPPDEEVRPKYYEEEEIVRPRYPNAIPYVPKKPLPSYTPSSPADYSPEPKPPPSSYSYSRRPIDEPNREDNSVPTTVKPFFRSHFNLGPHSEDQVVPKYGPIFKQVGKLSEAFHNQAPIPYFSPENSKELVAKEPEDSRVNDRYKNGHNEDRYREPVRYPINEQQNYNIDLKRYPVSKEPESTTYPTRNDGSERYRVNSETVKPFDFANYKPLPNHKFIRTDLESNEIPDKKYKEDGRPLIEVDRPIVERRPVVVERPVVERRPVAERPILERPIVDRYPDDERSQYDPSSAHLPADKPSRFNFNRIPAKVVYDKYNQKFSGRVNLKKVNFVPTAKHYADIPNHVQPIEYQARPTAPSVDTTVRNRPTYKPVYKPVYKSFYNNPVYNKPVTDKPERYKPIENYNQPVYNNKPAYNKPVYNKPVYNKPVNNKPVYNIDKKPIYDRTVYNSGNIPVDNKPIKPIYDRPVYNSGNIPVNNKPINNPPHYSHQQPKNDYNRPKENIPVFQPRPLEKPIIDQRPQFVSHFIPSNSRDIRPNAPQQTPRPNSRPAQFYPHIPVIPVNRQPVSQPVNQPNRSNNQFTYQPPKNQFNYEPPKNQFNYQPPKNQFNYQAPRNQFNYEPPKNAYQNRPSNSPQFSYNQPNRKPLNNQMSNQISNPFRQNQPGAPTAGGNLFTYSQPNRNQFNQFGNSNGKRQFGREINKYPQAKPPSFNSFPGFNRFDKEKPLYSGAPFDNNAGHYVFSDSDENPAVPLQPNKQDIELIDLNDLELFNGKMPDFKLLQNTVISHDIPTYKYLR